ncbi:T-cell surface glycoprotein CD4 isoform X2 [Oryzias latipes]|uniref:T-cell surface glycoprotein CD4 isoform X1 n=1 Tax=Oryzias latipes TaxID=8090 RepID=UPI0002A48E81|nr:T-cell surface glycoprotein CD4 isoform X1 [Oryzias latipes]XP_023805128.1 T-cell surface glycoprotein CD4 isoform X2 [Oryzias latipes]
MKVFWRVPVSLLLLAALSSVTCQDSLVLDGSVGGSVLLPCIFSEPLPNQINVFWRDKDDNAVFNIENGSPVFSDQNQRYQNRVFSFQEEFKNGNFSIQMKNLQISDSDTYVCNIVPGHKRRVQLRVSEVRPTLAPKTAGSSAGAAGPSILHVVLLAAVLLGC